jgi:uncharacterized membrane protein
MSKKMNILVFTSLVVNVLLVGYIIGDLSHRFRDERFDRKEARELASRLPKDKGAMIIGAMEKVHRDNHDAFRQIRDARREAMRILANREFNEAAYRAEVAKIHQLRGLMKERLVDATIELAKQFDQKDRKILAEYLRQGPRLPEGAKPERDRRIPPRDAAP